MTDTTITEMDYQRLNSIVEPTPEIEDLELEIERARIVDFPEIPTDLITMNTRLRYQNITDDKVNEIMIVYPQNANTEEKKISVLAPLGTALIGKREDDEVDLVLPDGKVKHLKVLEILYQPEANGDLHL